MAHESAYIMVMVKNKSKHKKNVWFKEVRGSYLPVSKAGWLTYIPFLAYLLFSAITGVKYTNSIAMAILFIVPNWVAATAIITYVAARKS